MSNLGGYQVLTTAAKKLGGPGLLVVAIAGTGYVVFRLLEEGGKTVYKKVKKKKIQKDEMIQEYIVKKDKIDPQGKEFKKGDIIRILDTVDDGFLIEIVGDKNNPYIVSYDFLKDITDFKG